MMMKKRFGLFLEVSFSKLLLYNDCRHGFWVRYWWPRVLWQPVTLLLVNRGVAVRWDRPVEQVSNREETTWYENHAVRFRLSIQSESRVEPGIHSRSEALVSSLTIWLARGCKRWHPLAPERRYGARRNPLSEYMSLHLSLKLTTNCVLLSRIKWQIYIFINKCVSFRSLKFVHWYLIMFFVGSVRRVQHHVQIFSCGITIVCRWCYLYSCFSLDFCFQVFFFCLFVFYFLGC